MKKVAIFLTLCGACLVGLMAAFPEDATRAAFAIERFRSGLEHRSVVMDGETWYYLDGGPTDAPVVLLLHGFGETARRLERDYSVSAQSDWRHDFASEMQLALNASASAVR
jgi:hypothetical protein